MERRFLIGGQEHVVEVSARREWSLRGEGVIRIRLDGEERLVEVLEAGSHHLDLVIDGRRVLVATAPGAAEGSLWVGQGGWARLVERAPERGRGGAAGGAQRDRPLVTPSFPATVVAVLVGVGDEVEQGQALVVVSAMKMELTLVAPHGGVVRAVNAAAGAAVAPGDELVVVEPAAVQEGADER